MIRLIIPHQKNIFPSKKTHNSSSAGCFSMLANAGKDLGAFLVGDFGKNFCSTDRVCDSECLFCLFVAAHRVQAKGKNNWWYVPPPLPKKTRVFVLDKATLCVRRVSSFGVVRVGVWYTALSRIMKINVFYGWRVKTLNRSQTLLNRIWFELNIFSLKAALKWNWQW